MTLEKSKIEIQDIIDIYEKEDMYPLLNDKQISALKVVISALQAQEAKTQLSAEGTTSDLISRQAAIEAMSESLKRVFPEHRQIAEKCLKALPPAQPEPQWIPCSERLPEELEAVIITWKNHEPEPYYSDIKHKPFIGVGIYHREKWWWWSAYAEDMLAEYGDSIADRMDEAIEVTAWMPLPEPYRAERRTDEADYRKE